MVKTNPIGILDIAVGTGTIASLKKFWVSCLDHENPQTTFTEYKNTASLYELMQQTGAECPQYWFQSSTITNHHFAGVNIEKSVSGFLAQLDQGLHDLNNDRIANIVAGSYKEVSPGNYEIVALRLGSCGEGLPDNCYAIMNGWSGFNVAHDQAEAYHSGHLHEWVVPEKSFDVFESFLKTTRTNDSLGSYCALHVVATDEVLHHWLLSIARASLSLHHQVFTAGQVHHPDFVLPQDYVTFSSKNPWICPPDERPSASCSLAQESRFPAIHLSKPISSSKPVFFENESDLFIFSSNSKDDLHQTLTGFSQFIRNQEEADFHKIARDLSLSEPGRYRTAIVASGLDDLTKKLEKAISGISKSEKSPSRLKHNVVWNVSGVLETKIAAVFPGQGSQRLNMLKALCMRFPKVRDWFDNLDATLASVNDILPSLTIFPPSDTLRTDKKEKLLGNLFSQEGGNAAVIIASIALDELLRSFNCYPDVLVGHSSGEISAMIISGSLRFETKKELFDYLFLINKKGAAGNARGEIPKGRFLAVTTTNANALAAFMDKHEGVVFPAMDNCPQQSVLFFPDENFEELSAELVQLGAICLPLYFDRAYHTPLFESEMPFILDIYSSLHFNKPATPIFSCIKLEPFPDDAESIRQWAALNWTHCVRFNQACQILAAQDVKIFIEVGPGGILSGFVDNTLAHIPHKALTLDTEGQDSYIQVLNALANLFVEGIDVDLRQLFEDLNALENNSISAFFNQKTVVVNSEKNSSDTIQIATRKNTSQHTKAILLRQHFSLMNEYLERESRVLNAFLKRASKSSVSIAKKDTTGFQYAAQSEKAVTGLPMIDAIVSRTHARCVSKRTIARNSDLFLQHHTLGRFTLAKPAETAPLPVVPLAMTIEMMAEAASLLAPEHYVVGEILNLVARRWMTIDEDTLVVILDAQVVSDGSGSDIKIQVSAAQEGDDSHPYCTATILMQAKYGHQVTPMPFSASVPEHVNWDAESFFEQCMFHGEAFSCMDKLLRLGKEEIEVQLSVPRNDILFAHEQQPAFKTAAQLLDVPGHTTAYWQVEMGDKLFGIFPISIDRLQFFAPPPPPFTKLVGRGKNKINGTLVSTEFEISEPDHSLYMKISGFRLIYYRFASSFLKSHYWTGPNTYYSDELILDHPDIIAFEAKSLGKEFVGQSGGLWLRSLVHMYCNTKEKLDWHKLPENGPRREQWLLGRIAAKEIVRKWAFHLHFTYILCPDIEISYDEEGRPFAICSQLEQFGPLPDISITHSGPVAVAIAASAGSKIGVDLEYFADKPQKDSPEKNKNLEIAFCEEELDYFRQIGTSDLYALVCAKEAASKAVGIGLLESMKSWKVRHYSNTNIIIEVMDEMIPVTLQRTEGQILTYCNIPEQLASDIKKKMKAVHSLQI
jgi:malonyl CoA-acyl carrier protein transacylase/phosphopantetheinyl transferase